MQVRVTDQDLYRRFFKVFQEKATPRCRAYVGDTGEPNGQAASLEALQRFKRIVDVGDPTSKILDAGVGVSSAMLHSWFPGRVVSIDPDAEYLESVMTTLAAMGTRDVAWLPAGFDFGSIAQEEIDFTFWDYGTIERAPLLPLAWSSTSIALYVDDCDTRADCLEMRTFVQRFAKAVGIGPPTDCPEAVDSYGRWGIILPGCQA